MSSTVPDRALPSFRSSEEEAPLARPVSGLAVVALLVGFVSLLVPFAVSLIPISAIAVLLGIIAIIRLSRPDSDLGLWMAILGLGLGMTSGVWALVANEVKKDHYEATAGTFAIEYMDLLSKGYLYNAMELRHPQLRRQPEGTDLQAYYEGYQTQTAPAPVDRNAPPPIMTDDAEPSPTLLAANRKRDVENFKLDPVTVYAQAHPNAKWTVRGLNSLQMTQKNSSILAVVQNEGDPNVRILVQMMRHYEDSSEKGAVAEWRVSDQQFSIARE